MNLTTPGTRTWSLRGRDSTSGRRRVGQLLVLFFLCASIALPLLAAPASAHPNPQSGGPFGTVGFVTRDGLFFVQVGYLGYVLNTFNAEPNGSQVFAYSIAINVTSIVPQNTTAYIHIFSYAQNHSIGNLTVPMTGYATNILEVAYPESHSYTEFRVVVDGTPVYYWYETPYSFLSITSQQDGGLDLIVFFVVGFEILCIGLPLWWWAERLTKRAIFCPRWNATIWLHGIFFGLFGAYILYFPTVNTVFHGTEWFFIPLPELWFIFFWTAGRHSTHKTVEFRQMVPRKGHRLGEISRKFYMGQDRDGDLVIIRRGSRSMIQWLYRAWGHHVKVFRRNAADPAPPPEPAFIDKIEFDLVPSSQFQNPSRFPRGARYDAMDDIPILNPEEDESDDVTRVYYVPRISQMLVTWPHWRWTRVVSVPAFTDKLGNVHPAGTKRKFSPHVEEGKAEVTLGGWHYADVYAQWMGWIRYEEVVHEVEDLEVRLAAEAGMRHTETLRRAEERGNAENDIRNRPYSDLTPEQLDAYVVRYKPGSGEPSPSPVPDESPTKRAGRSAPA